MKKIIAFLLFISLAFSTVGCDLIPDDTEFNGDEGNQNLNDGANVGDEENENWYNKAPWNGENYKIYTSHKDLISAWENINEFLGEQKENYYILPDNIGDGYTVVYRLHADSVCCDEEYIVRSCVQMFLPDTSLDMCPDTPDEKMINYALHYMPVFSNGVKDERLSIQIITIAKSYREIEDRSLLSMKKVDYNINPELINGNNMFVVDQPICYELLYSNNKIGYIRSCIELDQEVIDLIINNLCGLYDSNNVITH